MELKIPQKKLSDAFSLYDFQDDFNSISIEINNLKNREQIFAMPTPSTVQSNTSVLQGYLDIAKNGNTHVTVMIGKGDYEINYVTIYKNTTIIMNEETNLLFIPSLLPSGSTNTNIFYNAKPFDPTDSNITGYNGNGNIKIVGGTIKNGGIVLCHGKNITFEGVTFLDTLYSHAMQIGGCKDVVIKNCNFYGHKPQADDRRYVELIQVDWLTATGQPYWEAGKPIFDSTVCDGIYIYDSKFDVSSTYPDYIHVAIGSHSSDGTNRNKNIIIKSNVINKCLHSGITAALMENVTIENNVITNTLGYTYNGSNYGNGIDIRKSINSVVKDNKIDIARRMVYSLQNEFITMKDNKCSNVVSDPIFTVSSKNLSITNNMIVSNTLTSNSILVIRSCSNFSVNGNIAIDSTVIDSGYMVKVYVGSGDTDFSGNSITLSKNGKIYGNMSYGCLTSKEYDVTTGQGENVGGL